MRNKKRLIIILFILVVTLGLVVPVSAQSGFAQSGFAQSGSPISAEVDRNSLTTDDLLTLSVTVDDTVGAGQPQLPVLAGFELVSSGSSHQISIINGDMQVSTVYQYSLHPLATGELEIGPVTVTAGAQQYSTTPIKVTVSQGNGSPTQPPTQPGIPGFPNIPGFPSLPNFPGMPALPPTGGTNAIPGGQLDPADLPPALNGQEFFVEARVDNLTPYQGEQVIYHFRFYQATEIYEQPEYQAPSFNKLWHEEVPGQVEYEATAGGKTYRVTELTSVLFPTVPGEIVIDPATLVIPGGFFSRGGTLQTEPVTLQVQRLPEPAPAGFTGAVGVYQLTSQADPPATAVNDTVTWNVTLEGSGNIGNIADPAWPDLPAWRSFDSPAAVEAAFVDGHWQGTRRYERVMVPTESGDQAIPALEYVYFNPDSGVYETTRSNEHLVAVSGGPAGAGNAGNAANAAQSGSNVSIGNPASYDSAEPGLHPQKDAAAQPAAARPLTGNPLFWLAWLAPMTVFTGLFSWQKITRYRQDTAAGRFQAGAAGRAMAAIRRAKAQPELAANQDILVTYLSERLGEPLAGRTHQEILQRLETAGVDPALSGRVQTLLEQGEMHRYTPEASAGLDAFLVELAGVIKELDAIRI